MKSVTCLLCVRVGGLIDSWGRCVLDTPLWLDGLFNRGFSHACSLPNLTHLSTSLNSFTGSAGTAVVTTDKALLWTDGRYYLQAETELGADWTLMRGGSGTCPEVWVGVWMCLGFKAMCKGSGF